MSIVSLSLSLYVYINIYAHHAHIEYSIGKCHNARLSLSSRRLLPSSQNWTSPTRSYNNKSTESPTYPAAKFTSAFRAGLSAEKSYVFKRHLTGWRQKLPDSRSIQYIYSIYPPPPHSYRRNMQINYWLHVAIALNHLVEQLPSSFRNLENKYSSWIVEKSCPMSTWTKI
jgi:hypothetical protein